MNLFDKYRTFKNGVISKFDIHPLNSHSVNIASALLGVTIKAVFLLFEFACVIVVAVYVFCMWSLGRGCWLS